MCVEEVALSLVFPFDICVLGECVPVNEQKEGGWMLLGVMEMCLVCNEEEEEEEEGDGRGSWESVSRGLWKGVGKKKNREAGIEMEWKVG
ncbi:uncharacterized protein MONOS_14580 [Monocercomonoides exilis]|uniref:uncharacterized protein n=1 Tax=Monocercomonoides exilis TaxID=2049356 RepID=UPI0035598A8A|nr:hypothetical protein MONOS_14580 [Monocercomonoides exilis]|eukprot:MONOS_14580.1-p1 / transcript=MONOS_14580.1 / gene=MONOS_14580 / organism=Monocercomonoides_exilis_PA203 / gene_product=unspecified product / transcript_product=unspecified product / location=Mono_scaffold01028:3037-3306(+) / protein_length=90 / sequence_SO=supercontig / SO=protein_coding / is_pseudo=false